MTTYKFGLFDSHDQIVDETKIDENNPDLAMDLFKQSGKHIDETTCHYVMLLEESNENWEKESIYDSPNNFQTCSGTHPKSLTICMANVGNEKELKTLKLCSNFDYECDYEEGINIYCKHCWALGNYAVCDNNPKTNKI